MPQQLKHIVLCAFKDTATKENIQSIVDAFAKLKHKINGIHDFEWGTNVSPENLNQGFTHCFQLTFLSDEDRDAYLPHPAHTAFGDLLHPHLDKVLVIDYWANN